MHKIKRLYEEDYAKLIARRRTNGIGLKRRNSAQVRRLCL